MLITHMELLRVNPTPIFAQIPSHISNFQFLQSIAESTFPAIESQNGMMLNLIDVFGEKHSFRYRFWINNASRMYLIEGTQELQVKFNVAVGDVLVFARHPSKNIYVCGRKGVKEDSTKKISKRGEKRKSATTREAGKSKRTAATVAAAGGAGGGGGGGTAATGSAVATPASSTRTASSVDEEEEEDDDVDDDEEEPSPPPPPAAAAGVVDRKRDGAAAAAASSREKKATPPLPPAAAPTTAVSGGETTTTTTSTRTRKNAKNTAAAAAVRGGGGSRSKRVQQRSQEVAAAGPSKQDVNTMYSYWNGLSMPPKRDGVFRAVPPGTAMDANRVLAQHGHWTAVVMLGGELYQAFFDSMDAATAAFEAAVQAEK